MLYPGREIRIGLRFGITALLGDGDSGRRTREGAIHIAMKKVAPEVGDDLSSPEEMILWLELHGDQVAEIDRAGLGDADGG